MAVHSCWLVLLAAGAAAVTVAAYGGPLPPPLPLGSDQPRVDLPRRDQVVVELPLVVSEPLDQWEMYYRRGRMVPEDVPDDMAAEPGPQPTAQQQADESHVTPAGTPAANPTVTPAPTGVASWLPQRVQSWLPHLPSLSSFIPHLPSYIPGVNLEAEVHRDPTEIPSASDLVQRANHAVEDALARLRQREQQFLEIMKCACPRPAQCEALFQEFVSGKQPVAGSPPAPAGPNEPGLSLFAGITKPHGVEGPGFGFYVDKTGPHLGHHIHNGTATASAAAQGTSPAGSAGTTRPIPPPATAAAAAAANATTTAPAAASPASPDAIDFPKPTA